MSNTNKNATEKADRRDISRGVAEEHIKQILYSILLAGNIELRDINHEDIDKMSSVLARALLTAKQCDIPPDVFPLGPGEEHAYSLRKASIEDFISFIPPDVFPLGPGEERVLMEQKRHHEEALNSLFCPTPAPYGQLRRTEDTPPLIGLGGTISNKGKTGGKAERRKHACSLRKASLEDFISFCEQKGINTRQGKGQYQVLQVFVKGHGWTSIYKNKDESESFYKCDAKLSDIVEEFAKWDYVASLDKDAGDRYFLKIDK